MIEKLIAGNEGAMLAWDKAVRGEHGGNRNPTGRNQHTPEPDAVADLVKCDNITLDQPERQGGTSQQQGLRRLEKAASAGDGNAADLLRRVINPDDAMTVNGACVAMGWRKPIPASWCGNWTQRKASGLIGLRAVGRTKLPSSRP